VLFIDDIHLRKPDVVGNLCQAMKDFELDLIIEEGTGERSVKIDLAKTAFLI
jgi:Holliday junction resolvasome RuvABC ATP-dependent DNA helicase subunit